MTLILTQQEQAHAATNSPERLLTFPVIKSDAVVAGLQAQLSQQETLVNFYTTRYKEKYPKLIEARQRQEELRKSLDMAAVAALKTLDSVAEESRSKAQALERAVAEAEQQSLALSKLAIQYAILQREMESNRNLFQAILQRLKETDVSKGIEKASLSIVEYASTPAKPFRPNWLLLLLLGPVGGLALGIGLVLLLAQFDNTVKSLEDAEQRLGVPVLGVLPFSQEAESNFRKIIMTDFPDSMLAEGIRLLRATFKVSAQLSNRPVVLFTSAVPEEGKTMAVCNFAMSLAQQGLKTVIVDLDLRRPRIAKIFNLAPELPGVAEFLLGQTKLEDLKHSVVLEKLTVIPAGITLPHPSEQLASARLRELLEELRQQYDVVVLDSAPLIPVSDTLGFAAIVDVVLLVVCKRHTAVKVVRRAVNLLQKSGTRPTGLILNRMPKQNDYDYYGE